MKGCAAKSNGAPTRSPVLKEWAPRVNAEGEVSGGFAEPAAAATNRMPKDHVKWILAQKPLAPPPRYAALKKSNPDLTPRPGEEVDEERRTLYFLAKAFYEMEERFPKLQEWVREETKAKGYVEVSDEWLRDRAELNEMIDREWPKIQAKLDAIVLKQTSSHCEDDDENDSDKEDED
ncbi:hypothetical protein PR202_gb13554 [Eleusine coracana subsp. coracana]|uniref:Uncharacterized protein n=1 Tax=Eleusine coracana subsp. coracana TaxID=191504 RepID=A0AAV5ET55_ELECO|nr:hypothetical protein QOZ80_9BG0716590 [Eleusine coracana subsp. coracana]GJN25692.1 hypothetical protein PR202_gb13554 [Eleusine coracana subsp. coracana]